MKICFNGWFSGFIDKQNPGVSVDFFLELFKKVYNEDCEIGNMDDSEILCEFDMLLDCPGTFVNFKKYNYKLNNIIPTNSFIKNKFFLYKLFTNFHNFIYALKCCFKCEYLVKIKCSSTCLRGIT